MDLGSVLLFVHVLGAMGYAAGTLLSLFGVVALRRAQRVEQARLILGLMEVAGPLTGISLLVILAAGLYMTGMSWGWRTAWIDVGLLSTLILLVPTGAVMGIRRHALATQVAALPDGPLPESVQQRIHDPLLGASTIVLTALLVGIVFLMTVKPAQAVPLVVMGVSLVLGLLFSLPLWRRQHPASTAANAASSAGKA